MKTFLGRRVIMTTLDEIPRAFRACPGYIALNPREVEAINRNTVSRYKVRPDILGRSDPGDRSTSVG
jgi:hypothetical protein